MKARLLITAARVQHALDDLKALKEEAAHRDLPPVFALLEDAETNLQDALRQIDSAELLL